MAASKLKIPGFGKRVELSEPSKGESEDLKRREREAVNEAWREYEKLWPRLSLRFPELERELRYLSYV